MTRHSSIVGGSTAGRLLNCPGSYQATLALPAAVEVASEYAEEGTAMHKVMDRLMLMRMTYQTIELDMAFDGCVEARRLLGETFHDRQLSQQHLDTMIEPALMHLAALEQHYGDDFEVAAVEAQVRFPGVPAAFGTCDLILRSEHWVLVLDWKFGQGVGVAAVYQESNKELVNPQLLYYTAAALKTYPRMFTQRSLAVAIVQPRGDIPLSHTPISRKELKWFREDLENAVMLAIGRDPPRAKGEHCRFAPCKLTCPLWTGPLLDLSSLGLKPRTEMVSRQVTPYAEYLASAKALVDVLALFKKEVDEQLHAYLEDGGTVPGWKLKAKVRQRQWVDEITVLEELTKLGFGYKEIFQNKLVTFQSADATARRLGVKIPDQLRAAPPSTETAITTSDDPAPAVNRPLVIEQFSAALKALTANGPPTPALDQATATGKRTGHG